MEFAEPKMPKVNPHILLWARESAGLTLEEAARGIGLTGESASARLAEMESGEREPGTMLFLV